MSTPARPLLLPLVPLYYAALALREARLRLGLEQVRHLRRPVISIGSLSAGGAGKTPLTIALAQALMSRGLSVDVLSRGYARRNRLAARVDVNGTADEFGDEPLLIAREAGVPVYVAAQRYEAGLLAEANHPAAVHLLDDGFQHRQLHRDVNILLLDRNDWFVDRLLPAGNLREPLAAARRATIVSIPANDEAPEFEAALRAWGWEGPVWRLHRRIEVPKIEGSVAAFCGIARPQQFFAGLESAGLQVGARLSFADHYRYTAHDMERILSAARTAGARALVTTEKDRARMGVLMASFEELLPLCTVRLRVEIEGEDAAVSFLISRLNAVQEHA